ncbi:class I SAM-dependent methyltransferase [Maritimibacter sp. 55A14]|uniref:class I SAM-dependent methyltransferase n=1 Tax=Maritimibacter sp. 55A14 TaxID=2174844 RepID=UPI000D610C2A|nr:class I SAM-dependent methyltransferase [Maritimibacter sp. 55A14]PWE32859.1 class I SAM-dependent methyltransferase [Maritimibacter sp. 55A14]
MLDQRDPSRELVDFWNDTLEPKFTRFRKPLTRGLSLHSDQVIPQLDLRPGDRVLDVGCGFGDTAADLAERVAPGGHVTGLDCCPGFLAAARQHAEFCQIGNIDFREADAQTCDFAPEYDFVFSRFGTMFFASPVAGLKNMRRALKPGGGMTMMVWRTIDDNPCLKVPRDVVRDMLPEPGEDAQSCGPGPFSMAGEEMVSGQLRSAGYEDIRFTRIDAPWTVGDTVEEAIAFQLALGPAGETYREAGAEAEARHEEIVARLGEALAPYRTENGVVMASSSWRIDARNPE